MAWQKFTFTFDQFSDPGNLKKLPLLTLPAKGAVRTVLARPTTPFQGTGVDWFNLAIGSEAEPERLFPMNSIVGDMLIDNRIDISNGLFSFDDATDLFISASTIGAMLDQLSQGAVEIYLSVDTLP